MLLVRMMNRFRRNFAKLYPKTNPRISCVTIQVQVCRKTSFPQLIKFVDKTVQLIHMHSGKLHLNLNCGNNSKILLHCVIIISLVEE